MSNNKMKNSAILKEVKNWLEGKTADYDGNEKGVLDDLLSHGCISGMVGGLTFDARHKLVNNIITQQDHTLIEISKLKIKPTDHRLNEGGPWIYKFWKWMI